VRNKPRRPWIAALLTLLSTGLGHLYSGNPRRGLILFGIGQFLLLAFAVSVTVIVPNFIFMLFAVVVGFAFTIICIFDAVSIAKRKKENYELATYNRWFAYVGYVLLLEFLVTMPVSAIIKANLIEAYKLPTASMEPTLLLGDHLLVNKHIYKTTGPKRGDIIVLRYPGNPEVAYIKRLIGEPGDKVEMITRTVYINDRPLEEHYTQYIDPGSIHDHYGPYRVPPGQYFVMGDNRDNSQDSRYWGCVPRKNLLGKPLIIYWSFETRRDEYLQTSISDRLKQSADLFLNFFAKTRWQRTFQAIK
jgi:signal peptidase I